MTTQHSNLRGRATLVVTIWLLLVTLLGTSGAIVGMRAILPGPASESYLQSSPGEQLAQRAGMPTRDTLILILGHKSLRADDPRFVTARDSLYQHLQNLISAKSNSKVLLDLQTYGRTDQIDSARYISTDRQHLLFIGSVRGSIYGSAAELTNLRAELSQWTAENSDYSLHYLSAGTSDTEMFELIANDLDHSLIYTLPLTFVVLCYFFGSLSAALLPIFIALTSLVASLGASALLSHLLGNVSATASQLVVLLVLAIGVDYSLFIVSRVREEVAGGASYPLAITKAKRVTGNTILWSGLTVTISLLGLFLMEDIILSSMAAVSIISIAITVIAALYVLPAILALLGDRLEFGRVRRKQYRAGGTISPLLSLSVKAPKRMMVIGLALLGAVVFFARDMELGTTVEPRLLPRSLQSVRAFEEIELNFPAFAGPSLSITLYAENLETLESEGLLEPFLQSIARETPLGSPLRIDQSTDGSTLRYNYIAKGSGNSKENLDGVEKVHSELIQQHLRPLGVSAHLSGVLPYIVEDNKHYAKRTPIAILFVLALSFALLLFAFQSIVVPLKAVALNLLSTGAAFGTLVLVFQRGIFDRWQYGVVEAFVPSLLFAILFGISMDYHVLMLSRVQENVRAGFAPIEAVRAAIASSSPVITSAALIMVAVFGIIASLQLPIMKQLGLGLATAVLVDATIIRLILLPASLILLGEWNWYLPRWLRAIERFSISVKH